MQPFDSLAADFANAEDDGSRLAALGRLSSNFSGTTDKNVAALLARIALASTYGRDVRLAAYVFLFEVCGRDLWDLPNVGEFRVPEDLDLQFLRQCLNQAVDGAVNPQIATPETGERYSIWKHFAGDHYSELVRTKEAALAHLHDPDWQVRLAAIHVCDLVWNCSADREFAAACRRLAEADGDDRVRTHATSMLGKALHGTKEISTSQFLAKTVMSNATSGDLRRAAYWALRQVQFGLLRENSLKTASSLAKDQIDWDFVARHGGSEQGKRG